ncbi:hypothetical protein ALC56_03658, partial [Trachymyrmex septentrionalis]
VDENNVEDTAREWSKREEANERIERQEREKDWSLLHKLLNVIPAYMRSKTRPSTFFELTFLSNDKYRQMLPIPLDCSVEQQT